MWKTSFIIFTKLALFIAAQYYFLVDQKCYSMMEDLLFKTLLQHSYKSVRAAAVILLALIKIKTLPLIRHMAPQ